MHPLMWMILIVLGLYAAGGLQAPKRDSHPLASPAANKHPERVPMTEQEKRFGCRFTDTTPSGECP